MLIGPHVLGERLAGLVEEPREVLLEPVAVLGRVAQVAAGLAVDPLREVDPLRDLFRTIWPIWVLNILRICCVNVPNWMASRISKKP
jgi:hypothetical protein